MVLERGLEPRLVFLRRFQLINEEPEFSIDVGVPGLLLLQDFLLLLNNQRHFMSVLQDLEPVLHELVLLLLEALDQESFVLGLLQLFELLLDLVYFVLVRLDEAEFYFLGLIVEL